MYDPIQLFLGFCQKVSDFPDELYKSEDLLKNVDYKFMVLNGAGPIRDGLKDMMNYVLNAEKQYKQKFVILAIVFPTLIFFVFLLLIPVNCWVWTD